jgi:hypothetical protein
MYVVGAVVDPQEARRNVTPTARIIRTDFIFTLASVSLLLSLNLYLKWLDSILKSKIGRKPQFARPSRIHRGARPSNRQAANRGVPIQ